MGDISSKLFRRSGYISLREYLDDIERMRKSGPWKIPLGIGDRFQFFFLKAIARFSWFSDVLSVGHPNPWSPSYSILVSYLRKRGFVDEVTERNSHHAGYSFFSFQKNIFVNEYNKPVIGFGCDQDVAIAFSKALGEIIERLISGLYNRDRNILIASPDELEEKSPMFYPPKYHRFLDIQRECYRELEYHPSNPIDWMRGVNLITRKRTYIPRHIVSWFGFADVRIFKDILLHSTSNGCAGYFTKIGAVLRGLLEVVHRDAFLVHWLTQIAPPVIRQDTLPEDIQAAFREFQSRGVSLFILDVTALSIPSVSIVGINADAEIPQIILSGASALTFEQAIRDALREMVLMSAYMFYRGSASSTDDRSLLDSEPFISDLNENTRQLYWRGTERIKQFQWFLSGVPVSYDEVCKQNISSKNDDSLKLKACLDVLKERGNDYYPIVYFPKHPIQEELGFYVAQVYIPKAFPLYLLEYQGTFDSDRLEEFALSKGISDWKLNPLPHMFS